jgi:tellurite resistance protein
MSTFTAQDSLVATMLLVAAADTGMNRRETEAVTAIVGLLPAFRGFEPGRIAEISTVVLQMLQEENGIDQILSLVEEGLPDDFAETAYALACDVAAADESVGLQETRLLGMLRERLGVERLSAAAIERAARARHRRLPETGEPA